MRWLEPYIELIVDWLILVFSFGILLMVMLAGVWAWIDVAW